MAYMGGAFTGFCMHGRVTSCDPSAALPGGGPDVAIHVAGGVANRLGPDELAGFAAAVSDDGGTIGLSLYDWETTPPGTGACSAPSIRRTPSFAQPVAGLEQVLGKHFDVRENRHEVRVADQRGTTCRWTWSAMPARRTAEVPAQVEAVRAVDSAERVERGGGEPVEPESFRVRELAKDSGVANGAVIRCPDEYGYLFRSTSAGPRRTRSDSSSGSSPAPRSRTRIPRARRLA